MKIYRTTVWPLAIVFAVSLFGFILFGLMETADFVRVVKGAGLFALIPAILVTFFGLLTYLKINGKDQEFVYVESAIYQKKVSVSRIVKISQEGTYRIFQSLFRSLFVYYIGEKEQTRFVHLSMALYSESTLQQLLKDLLVINPNIKLDKNTERLLRTGKIKLLN